MRYLIFALASCAFLSSNTCLAKVVIKATSNSGGIRVGGDAGNGQHDEFYAIGNETPGNFEEYGILGFTFDATTDFGFPSISSSDIKSVQLTLAVNDRAFSNGELIEFFFTPDTFASLGDGSNYSDLSFDIDAVNGLNASQFTTAPTSLGTYSFPDMEERGGETDLFDFNFTGAQLDLLADSINGGTDFQIIGGVTDPLHQITYLGFDNNVEGENVPSPMLSITAVPEPATFSLLSVLASVGLIGFRRRL